MLRRKAIVGDEPCAILLPDELMVGTPGCMAQMVEAYQEVGGNLNFIERSIYRYIVFPRVQKALMHLSEQLQFIHRQKDWGPGRVDTFNPYKAIQFNFPVGPDHISDTELNGSADFPAIWQQRPREGLQLHWDGNNTSVDERNLSAALGAGVTPVTVNRAAIKRVRAWIWDLPAPAFPVPSAIDQSKVEHGRTHAEHCAVRHARRVWPIRHDTTVSCAWARLWAGLIGMIVAPRHQNFLRQIPFMRAIPGASAIS
jgi:hypothetical protein